MRDEELHEVLRAMGKRVVEHYSSKITGVRHLNEDGKHRSRLVEALAPYEPLLLRHLPDNPVDAQAVGIFTQDGQQLGYLPERTAHDLLDRGAEPGCSWLALFRDWYPAPEGKHAVGALIELVLFRDE